MVHTTCTFTQQYEVSHNEDLRIYLRTLMFLPL